MKIHLTDKQLANLAEDCENARVSQNPRDPDGVDYNAIAEELAFPKRDEKGRVEVSRQTFDWIWGEFVWVYDDYKDNRRD